MGTSKNISHVTFDGVLPVCVILGYGVPQGSVLQPAQTFFASNPSVRSVIFLDDSDLYNTFDQRSDIPQLGNEHGKGHLKRF